MNALIHVVHAVLAGAWLGGVVFTTFVVSPALKAMRWGEAERVSVRSEIGKQYAKVGGANLALLIFFALADGVLAGLGTAFYVECLLLVVLAALVAVHGAYFGRKLRGLAEAERRAGNEEAARSFAQRRRSLQNISSRVSWLTLLVSVVVMVLAIGV